MNKLMLQMMGAFAEFERALIKERQREGIAQAQKKGVKIGRKNVLNDDQVKEIVARVDRGESKGALAKEFKVARQTIYSALLDQKRTDTTCDNICSR